MRYDAMGPRYTHSVPFRSHPPTTATVGHYTLRWSGLGARSLPLPRSSSPSKARLASFPFAFPFAFVFVLGRLRFPWFALAFSLDDFASLLARTRTPPLLSFIFRTLGPPSALELGVFSHGRGHGHGCPSCMPLLSFLSSSIHPSIIIIIIIDDDDDGFSSLSYFLIISFLFLLLVLHLLFDNDDDGSYSRRQHTSHYFFLHFSSFHLFLFTFHS
ncbi:hypothetical protein BDN70DRAFT_410598 [Pholiota conissans]|uniref:Uncharacterized protein n=1 Tax=Pholiota conissans TaxID=109636 RepID=A0A9P6CX76_9AGAR|nr:hypothetical protein BDN70DRAFT_410598 [Pholiota conissans]